MIPHYRVLQRRIEEEIAEVERSVATALRHWHSAETSASDQEAYVNSVALNLHSFYTGLERIFELVAAELDESTPRGSSWHQELLRQMALDLGEARPPVISRDTANRLDEYRKFRHRVRSLYAAHLDPDRMRDLVRTLPEVWRQARQDIEQFLAYLDQLARAER